MSVDEVVLRIHIGLLRALGKLVVLTTTGIASWLLVKLGLVEQGSRDTFNLLVVVKLLLLLLWTLLLSIVGAVTVVFCNTQTPVTFATQS